MQKIVFEHLIYHIEIRCTIKTVDYFDRFLVEFVKYFRVFSSNSHYLNIIIKRY